MIDTLELKLYNAMTQTVEVFKPIHEGLVHMYVCGPTVYDHIHIGNARPVIVFDMVKRVLEAFGYRVLYVSNITDIDDKIIDRAISLNISEQELTETYTNAYMKVSIDLGSKLPDMMPKATSYIQEMITYIQELIDTNHAYVTPSGVYFNISKAVDYGSLSKQVQEFLESDVRITNNSEKQSSSDFNLWKLTNIGVSFESPWGNGRPGWHTECAVMNHEIFKGMIDIHGGGLDLKFPHHENERAQSLVHDHHGLAKYWMHNGRLDFKDEKMSKSLGNVVLVKDLETSILPAFRMLTLAHHYRGSISFTDALLEEYKGIYLSILSKVKLLSLQLTYEGIHIEKQSRVDKEFLEILSKDFDTPNAITKIYDIVKQMNKATNILDKAQLLNTFISYVDILGIDFPVNIKEEDVNIYGQWMEARRDKSFSLADELRLKLAGKGYM
jgi:cysteinyl-tRNA synthetase